MRFRKVLSKVFYILPLAWRVRIYFLYRHKYTLSLSKPLTFSEKTNYRKLHPLDIYSTLADKYSVREYVSKKIGSKYLIPLQCLLSNGDDFPELNGKYVAKTTHGSEPDHFEFLPTKKTTAELKKNSTYLWLKSLEVFVSESCTTPRFLEKL